MSQNFYNLFFDVKNIFISLKMLIEKYPWISLTSIIVYFSFFLIDQPIRNLFLTLHNNTFYFIFGIARWYGKPYLTLISFLLLYLSGILFNKNKLKDSGWKIFEAFAISGIIVTVIKSIFGRWRPYTEHGHFSFVFFTLGPNDHLSLPSGDVAIAFSFSTIVASFIDNKAWKIFWFTLAVLTSLGRIYHDQHWFTDVIMGTAIALLVGININKQHKNRLIKGDRECQHQN